MLPGVTSTPGPQRWSSATCNATANSSTPPTGTNVPAIYCALPWRRRGRSGSIGPLGAGEGVGS